MGLLLCSLEPSCLSLAALLPLLGFFLDLFPTTWVDPSGHVAEGTPANDLSILALMYTNGGLSGLLHCLLEERCRDALGFINNLGSQGANLLEWSAENLYDALFSTYPHEPTPVDPGLIAFSIALSNTPVWGDLYDLTTGITGYDFITGQYLASWERLANIIGVIPIPGVSGGILRHGVDEVDAFASRGDDLARFIGYQDESDDLGRGIVIAIHHRDS